MITNQPINLRVTHHPSDSHHSINSYLNWPNSPFSPALRFQSLCVILRELIIDKDKSNVILLVNGQQKPVVSEKDL